MRDRNLSSKWIYSDVMTSDLTKSLSEVQKMLMRSMLTEQKCAEKFNQYLHIRCSSHGTWHVSPLRCSCTIKTSGSAGLILLWTLFGVISIRPYVTSTTCLSSSIRGANSFSRLMMRPNKGEDKEYHPVVAALLDVQDTREVWLRKIGHIEQRYGPTVLFMSTSNRKKTNLTSWPLIQRFTCMHIFSLPGEQLISCDSVSNYHIYLSSNDY